MEHLHRPRQQALVEQEIESIAGLDLHSCAHRLDLNSRLWNDKVRRESACAGNDGRDQINNDTLEQEAM